MLRLIVTTFIVSCLAGPALAGSPAATSERASANVERSETRESTRYGNTLERWRGAPYLKNRASAHPAGRATASEAVLMSVPQANYLVEGRIGASGF